MLRAIIALLVLLVPSIAQAEARFALLIGNQVYDRSVGVLKKPAQRHCHRRGTPEHRSRNETALTARAQPVALRREPPRLGPL
jgi:hypothetical protein